jgi:hypothetical protein
LARSTSIGGALTPATVREHPAQHAAQFRFFDRDLVLRSDDASVVEAMRAVYARHAVPGETVDDRQAASLQIEVRAAGRVSPVIQVEGRRVHVPSPAQLEHYAHLVLINAAAAAASGVVVLHAGAVVRAGRATLLVGPSGWGKSTLTLELVRRGWGFLSDDFAPVSTSGVVAPFPRAVNVTEQTLGLLRLDEPESGLRLASAGGRQKWMLDIDTVYPGHLAEPAPMGHVFVLSPSNAGDDGPDRRWTLQLDRVTDGLASALAALPGVQEVRRRWYEGTELLDVYVVPGAQIVTALDEVCRAHDVAVLAADRAPWASPNFAGQPRAAALPVVEGARAILAHATSLSGQRFLYAMEPSAALRSLAHIHQALATSGASVYRLEPGDLLATASLVESLTRT